MEGLTKKQRYMLIVLLLVYACHIVDRTIVLVLLDPIKKEYGLSDTQLGLFSGLAFALGTLAASLPLGTFADRGSRKSLLAACIGTWSAMTLLCGLAGNYLSLLLLRFGVGAAEAGLQPTALSMISDAVPASHRTKAIATVHMGIAIGTLIGFVAGGWVATHFGWRAALLIVGFPGLVLALVVALTIGEPARISNAADPAGQVSLAAFFALLWRDKALLHVVLAVAILWLCTSSSSAWWASFFLRSYELPLATIGVIMAGATGIGGLVGNFMSSVLSERLARGRPERLALLAFGGAAIYFPLSLVTLLAHNLVIVVTTLFLQMVCYFLIFSPAYSLAMGLAEARIRGRTAAIMAMGATVIGYGIGPQVVGLLSDVMQPTAGKESLRYALVIAMLIILWCAGHLLLAYRQLRASNRAADVASRP
jgi:predicted MFS family arabinose efflux permease